MMAERFPTSLKIAKKAILRKMHNFKLLYEEANSIFLISALGKKLGFFLLFRMVLNVFPVNYEKPSENWVENPEKCKKRCFTEIAIRVCIFDCDKK